MNFKDRVVIVTGAAGHLGRAVAQAFAEQGARLVLVDLRREGLDRRSARRARAASSPPPTCSQQAEADAVAKTAIERFGRIDVLCNIAGGFRMGEAVHETSDANWNFLFDLNARTVLHSVRAVVPRMIEGGGGKVVSVAAAAGLRGEAQKGAYCASKSVVIRLTEAMAAELREKDINVNCVLPTIIDTPDNRAAMPGADPARWVSPQDLANAILFLSSDAARAVHGAALPVSGLS